MQPTCTELPKKTEEQAMREKESPAVDEWINRRPEKKNPSLLQVNLSSASSLTVYRCIAPDNQMTVTLVKEEKIDSRGQTTLRKQQIVCGGVEIEAFKKSLSNTFNCTMSIQEKKRRLKITPSVSILMSVSLQYPFK